MGKKHKKHKKHKKSKLPEAIVVQETDIIATPLSEPLIQVVDEEDIEPRSSHSDRGDSSSRHKDTNVVTNSFEQGQQQERKFRDKIPAILYILHIFILMIIASQYSVDAIENALHSKTDRHYYVGYLQATVTLSFIALLISTILFRLILYIGKYLVKSFLAFALVLSLLFIFQTRSSILMSVIGIFMLLAVIAYGYTIWGQIKLTSALLNLTFSCVKDNFGVVYITFGYVVGAYAYSLLWLLSLIAVNENTKLCDAKNHCRTNIFILIPFVMVYLWAFHVIKNSVWTAIAGIVGVWWTRPEEASGCVSPAVKTSFGNITKYSFGTICYGALITPYVQLFNEIINPNGDQEFLRSYLSSSFVNSFDEAVGKFNQWGYIYAGLYGYSFNESAERALNVFRARKFLIVSSNHIVRNVFYLNAFGVGLLMSEIAAYSSHVTDWFDDDGGFSATFDAQILGFIIGVVTSMIVFAVITGSILTIKLLFAEKPESLDDNHPIFYGKMIVAIEKVHPGVLPDSMIPLHVREIL